MAYQKLALDGEAAAGVGLARKATISAKTIDPDTLTPAEKNLARYIAWIVIVFTSVNYGMTSAAQARKKYDAVWAKWLAGAYYTGCSVTANAYFDFEAVEEDLAAPAKEYSRNLARVILSGTNGEKAFEAVKILLGLAVLFGAFNTSFTTKLPGQKAIEDFADIFPSWLSATLQVMNDIYAVGFVTLLFTSGTFQLPEMIKRTFQPKNAYERKMLLPSLGVGLALGVSAYLVFAKTLWNFPENRGTFNDPFNDYEASLITAAPWTAYLSALTRGSFCILFAQRGFVELTLEFLAAYRAGVKELAVRLGLLAFVGFIAVGSFAPSAFQAGDDQILSDLISACAFFVNGYGVAIRLRKWLQATPTQSLTRVVPDVENAADKGGGDSSADLITRTPSAEAPRLGCLPRITPMEQLVPDDAVPPVSESSAPVPQAWGAFLFQQLGRLSCCSRGRPLLGLAAQLQDAGATT